MGGVGGAKRLSVRENLAAVEVFLKHTRNCEEEHGFAAACVAGGLNLAGFGTKK